MDYQSKFLHFLDIPETVTSLVPDTKEPTVPCITDANGESIQDSRKIALYLEEKYPEPSIFHGGKGVHFFFDDWALQDLFYRPYALSLLQLYSELDDEAQEYYRPSREKILGCTLEEFAGNPEDHLAALNKNLALVTKTLERCDFVTGDMVGWADICLASHLVILEKFHPDTFADRVLGENEHVKAWWERMQKYSDCDK